jgi:putative peptidoglycan lipid II flippase
MISASGVSIIAQAISFFRQILIAAYFGVTRDLDVYFMTFAIATLLIFTFATIFDSVGIPHLVKALEEKGENTFRKLTGSIFTFSVLTSLGLSLFFIVIIPPIAHIMAAGFSSTEKREIWHMAVYFLPWTLISLPYYAMCSFYKSKRYFNLVFVGDIIISFFTVCALILYHPNPFFLPLSYFIGYFFAFIFLFTISFRYFDRIGTLVNEELKKVIRNFLELFGTSQIGSISSMIERFLQSFMPSGGISALAYSQQITMAAGSFLSFREMFIVPLSSSIDRAKKLERLLIGLAIITIPVMTFLFYYTHDIVMLLFQRGKFNIDAAHMTSSVLSIYFLALLPSVAGVPIFRLFQVIDRIRYSGMASLLAALNFAVIGWGVVFLLKMGVVGLALMVTVNSYITVSFCIFLLRRGGIHFDIWRVVKYAGYAALSSMVMIGIMRALPEMHVNVFVKLFLVGCIYVTLIVTAYLPIRKQIFKVVNG